MDLRNQIFVGDALRVLKAIPDNSVHTCVTSPPYFHARDYGFREWIGGDPACEHDQSIIHAPHHPGALEHTFSTGKGTGVAEGHRATTQSCSKCSAWYGQLGLEPTLDLYVKHVVLVFRELRRGLRADGTCWLNIGDGYSYHSRCGAPRKNLLLVPSRVAVALLDDGWVVRDDIIWSKNSTLPESVKDRPTRSHEYVFLLAKSDRYFYDTDAIAEDAVTGARRNSRSVWTINPVPYRGAHFAVMPPELAARCIKAGTGERGCCATCGRPLGWGRPCTCPPKAPVPAIVLDPFAGSGTTLMAARQLGRDFIGIEASSEYMKLILDRVTSVQKASLPIDPTPPANDTLGIKSAS